MADRPAPAGLQRFVVRLFRSSGGIAGLGVLVGDREIMTCAHVVNTALSRSQEHADQPGDDDLVDIDFPLLPETGWRGQARVSRWLSPPGKDVAGSDIAGLAFTGEPPDGASPAKLARALTPHRLVDVFGYPRGRPGGVFVEARVRYEVRGGVLQLDSTTGSALRIRPGFSGSPVCDRDSGDVIGLLWMAPRADSEERDSFAITAKRLRSAWPEVLAEVGREVGQVTTGLLASEWPLLARDVQEHESLLPRQLIEREWLLAEIEAFCLEHDRGYFLIEGDAGMGKTTFAAWLAWQKRCAAHFAQLDPDAGTTKVAVRSLGAQLIAAWNLQELAPRMVLPEEAGSYAWFRSVLQAAARSRDEAAPGTPIILVADALDAAAEHPPGHLPMGLPDQLPGGVYIVATARPGGLPHEPAEETYARCVLDRARDENMADLRQYIARSAAEGSLARAIASARITLDQFTASLLEPSLGSWIYVRHVLEAIRQDPAKAGELPALPRGLKNYYDSNVASLCEGSDGTSLYLPLLATLAVVAEHVDVPTLAALAGVADRRQVQHAVDRGLLPYCSVTHAPGERRSLFRIGHPSLSEYLRGNPDAAAADHAGVRREEIAEACQDAQSRICDRYLNAWGGLDRGLPGLEANPDLAGMDRGYGLRWLASHLLIAGRDGDLHSLLACGPRGTNIWFAAHDRAGNVAGYLRDVDLARGAAPRLGTQLRYALIQASIASLSSTLPPGLIGELVTRHEAGKPLWDPSRAFRYVERMADEQRQAQALARIAPLLPRELLGPALSVAMRLQHEENRAAALEAVIPHLPRHLLERAVEAVFGAGYGPGYSLASIVSSPDLYLPAMVAIMAKLPGELLQELCRSHVRAFNQVSYVDAAYALFWHDDPLQGTRHALAKASELRYEDQRGLLVAALMPHFPRETFDDVLAVLATTRYLDAAMVALAEHAPGERMGDLLDFAQGKWHPTPAFFRKVTRRLTADHALAALRLCKAVSREEERAEAFAALAPILDSDQARRFLKPDQSDPFLLDWPVIVREILDLHLEEPRLAAVSALLDRLPPEEAREVVRERILEHGGSGPLTYRSQVPLLSSGSLSYRSLLPLFGRHLPDDLRREALGYIYDGLKWPRNEPEKHAALLARFTPLSDHEVAEAFDHAQANSWSDARLAVADVLAPCLDDRLLRDVLQRVMAFPLEKECFAALAALGRVQPPDIRDKTAARGLAMAVGIGHVRSKAGAVAALGPILTRFDLATAAFAVLWSIDPFWGVRAMEAMADVLPAQLLQAVPDRIRRWIILDPRLDIPRIIDRLAAHGHTAVIDRLVPDPEGSWDPNGWGKALATLARHLSGSKIRKLWHLWHGRDHERLVRDGAEALSSLVSRLPADERAAAVDEILAAYRPWHDWDTDDARFLGRLARAAPTERLTQTLSDMLGRERGVQFEVLAELAPGLPETLIDEALRYALSDHDDWNCQALAKLAPRLSGTPLNRAISYVNEVRDRRWAAVALTALARQLPSEGQDRETVLAAAVEAAASWPSQSRLGGVMASLIPQLPDRLRAPAVSAAIHQACRGLDLHRGPDREELDRLRDVLAVLRGPELDEFYAQLGREVRNPQVRARSQAAVIRQAGSSRVAGFMPGGKPLHHDWPGDLDRARLMGLIAAAAWWIDQNGGSADIADAIEAVFDVARWWP